MEAWRMVWRTGVCPSLSTKGLIALKEALACDDQRLVQGATTSPPPLLCIQGWPVEACCAIGFSGWQSEELVSVGEVEEFFAKVCYEADYRLGEPTSIRYWLNHWDDAPRDELFREVGKEIELELATRKALAGGAA